MSSYYTYYNLKQKGFYTNIYTMTHLEDDTVHARKLKDSIRPQLNSKTEKEEGVEVGRELSLLRCSPETRAL